METSDVTPLWIDEIGFSNWLHFNIDVLATALGLSLVSQQREAPVGRLSADILAGLRDSTDLVIIENQVKPANHGHFGQILTYSAHYEARVIVWIATAFRSEYRTAVAWLNGLCDKRFYAVELRGDGYSIPELVVVAGPESIFEASPAAAEPVVLPPSPHRREGDQRGAYVRAQFDITAPRTVSPGQLVLNAIFERIAQDLAEKMVFPSLRKPTGDRNYYVASTGPVRASEWAITFENSQVGIALVFNDPLTAKRDLERVRNYEAEINSALGGVVDMNVAESRKKQKAILYRPLRFEERSQDADGVAGWCADTITTFKKTVDGLRIFSAVEDYRAEVAPLEG